MGFACALLISSLILPVKEQYYPSLNRAELPLKSEFCLCKEYAVPFYGHFSVRVFFFFTSESKQLFFGCSDLLHSFTTSSEFFTLGITVKILSENETCRNQVVFQQLSAEKQVLWIICVANFCKLLFIFFLLTDFPFQFTAKIYLLRKGVLEFMGE